MDKNNRRVQRKSLDLKEHFFLCWFAGELVSLLSVLVKQMDNSIERSYRQFHVVGWERDGGDAEGPVL